MEPANITSAVLFGLMALIYGVVAFWISKRRKPIHFIAGDEVRAEEITDVRAYNRANSKMWAIYAIIHVLAGLFGLLSSTIAIVLFMLLLIPGLIILFVFHKRIYDRFKAPGSRSRY
jgi:membrane protease YdiL (CAAX protease family)